MSSKGAVRIKEIVTPEGVPIRMKVAGAGDRLAAVILDYLLMLLITVVLSLVLLPVRYVSTELHGVTSGIMAFVVHYFYFIAFEVRWQGRTPGKRAAGIRVIDRGGGPLGAPAIIARNLTRDVEIYYPVLLLMFSPLIGLFAGWFAVVPYVWILGVLFFPLFNRDRLRLGDLVGGTLVVTAPKAVLLRDLTSKKRSEKVPRYSFTREQLDLYGVYELQVLERLLRRTRGNSKTLDEVCRKIKNKIAWDKNNWKVNTREFLDDFYLAQRGRLEHRMQFGDRQERKKEGRLEHK